MFSILPLSTKSLALHGFFFSYSRICNKYSKGRLEPGCLSPCKHIFLLLCPYMIILLNHFYWFSCKEQRCFAFCCETRYIKAHLWNTQHDCINSLIHFSLLWAAPYLCSLSLSSLFNLLNKWPNCWLEVKRSWWLLTTLKNRCLFPGSYAQTAI